VLVVVVVAACVVCRGKKKAAAFSRLPKPSWSVYLSFVLHYNTLGRMMLGLLLEAKLWKEVWREVVAGLLHFIHHVHQLLMILLLQPVSHQRGSQDLPVHTSILQFSGHLYGQTETLMSYITSPSNWSLRYQLTCTQ